jgi:hypothetical protein
MKNYILILLTFVTGVCFSQAPTVTQIAPTSATGDVIVTIVGTNFTNVKSVILRSSVDASVPFSVPNPTTILARVKLSATNYINGRNGSIFIVTNNDGSNTTGPNFDYTPLVGACNSIVYGDWSDCKNGVQKRNYIASPTGCAVPPRDSVERKCIIPKVRILRYNANENFIEVLSNMPGTLDVISTGNNVVQTYTYNKASDVVDVSGLPPGDYTAVTYDKSIKFSTKFQLVIESTDILNLVVKGKYGTPPYLYSLNSVSNFTSELNILLTKASHVIRCKDATGKISALNVTNTYTNCTLRTTTVTYDDRTQGSIPANDSSLYKLDTTSNVYYSPEYITNLANETNNLSIPFGSTYRDGIPPTVSIQFPRNDTAIVARFGNVNIFVTAYAKDNVGVASVAFYWDNTLIAINTTPQGFTVTGDRVYNQQYYLSNVPDGVHIIKAVATDSAGNGTLTSIQIGVNVSPIADVTPPFVAFASPWVNGYTVYTNINYIVNVTATDNVGVKYKRFYRKRLPSDINSGLCSTLPASVAGSCDPDWYLFRIDSILYAPPSNLITSVYYPDNLGLNYLKVVAVDFNGNKDSSTILVNVQRGADFSLQWLSPSNRDTSVIAGANAPISVSAVVPGGIKKIEFYYATPGTNSIFAVDSVAPYSVIFNTAGRGPTTPGAYNFYTISLRIYDSVGNMYYVAPGASNVSSTCPLCINSFAIVRIYNGYISPTPIFPRTFKVAVPISGNQRNQGSCCSYTSAWAFSSLEYYRTNSTYFSFSTNIFSPKFIYNRNTNITTPPGSTNPYDCQQGSNVISITSFLRDTGACRFAYMPVTSSAYDCLDQPGPAQFADAANYKLTNGYTRVLTTDSIALKTWIYNNKRVLLQAFSLDNTMINAGPGFIWTVHPEQSIGHCMNIVGWDDTKHAWLIQNQWGTAWGDQGFIWVDYDLLLLVAGYYSIFYN